MAPVEHGKVPEIGLVRPLESTDNDLVAWQIMFQKLSNFHILSNDILRELTGVDCITNAFATLQGGAYLISFKSSELHSCHPNFFQRS